MSKVSVMSPDKVVRHIRNVLGEKNIICSYDRDNYGPWPKASGIYKFINNEIIGSIKQY